MKIVIIGKGYGWHKAPHAVEDGEIWGVNNICLRRTVDLAFNIHDLERHSDHNLFMKTIAYVNQHKIPIVTQKKYDWIPTCIPFPMDFFKSRQYFTNSIDYMVAYAIYLGTTRAKFRYLGVIEMFGVVMGLGSEYAHQRPSLEYWIGQAEGNSIQVILHEPSHVCKSPMGRYGYDWDEEDLPHVKNRSENR